MYLFKFLHNNLDLRKPFYGYMHCAVVLPFLSTNYLINDAS